jgi:hypothetical protein
MHTTQASILRAGGHRRAAVTVLFGLIVAVVAGLATRSSAAPAPQAPGLKASVAAAANAGPPKGYLLVRYKMARSCSMFLNYPNHGRSVPVKAGATVIWRYNVDKTWSTVSVVSRAGKGQYPWWGSMQRSCIGKSIPAKKYHYRGGDTVPTRLLQGRSGRTHSGWISVGFRPAAAPITHKHILVKHSATLRDGDNFVIGNVPSGWHVDVTSATRTGGVWVKVRVPNLGRYGYIEARKLR